MNESTRQLTTALQELTQRKHSEGTAAQHSEDLCAGSFSLNIGEDSPVDKFLEEYRGYVNTVRLVNIGSY